jgi:hypothetical protein
MRIAFITGCLAPGRDGVGDFTRRVADECRRRGHVVALLAVGEPEPVAPEAGNALTLRLTRSEFLTDGGERARAWLSAFGADRACLQFVPYSFDPRGLFGPAVGPLSRVLNVAATRQVFVHEIWIGSQLGADWKSRLIGAWQRRTCARLWRALAPLTLHTSNAYYAAALAHQGRPARILPLIGAVPRMPGAPLPEALAELPPEALLAVHFGTVHPGWDPDDFLAGFGRLARQLGRAPTFWFAGAVGAGASWRDQIVAKWGDRIRFVADGPQPVAQLAAGFARADLGVSSVPWTILGKSSSVAALREHGLPVCFTRAGAAPRFATGPLPDPVDAGLHPLFRAPETLAHLPRKTAPRSSLDELVEAVLAPDA